MHADLSDAGQMNPYDHGMATQLLTGSSTWEAPVTRLAASCLVLVCELQYDPINGFEKPNGLLLHLILPMVRPLSFKLLRPSPFDRRTSPCLECPTTQMSWSPGTVLSKPPTTCLSSPVVKKGPLILLRQPPMRWVGPLNVALAHFGRRKEYHPKREVKKYVRQLASGWLVPVRSWMGVSAPTTLWLYICQSCKLLFGGRLRGPNASQSIDFPLPSVTVVSRSTYFGSWRRHHCYRHTCQIFVVAAPVQFRDSIPIGRRGKWQPKQHHHLSEPQNLLRVTYICPPVTDDVRMQQAADGAGWPAARPTAGCNPQVT
jgi:hypothetical protein